MEDIKEKIKRSMKNSSMNSNEIDLNTTILADFYIAYAKKSDLNVEDFLKLNPVPDVRRINSKSYKENFREWAGTDKAVIEPFEIKDFDFAQKGPFVIRCYHGTTHNVEEFKALEHGNKEGHFGAVNYFTSDFFDAQNNYAGEGPDMSIKIEKLADEIMYDEQFIKLHGENNYEEAEEYARSKLIGDYEQVLEVYIKTENPFILGGDKNIFIDFVDFDEIEEKAILRILDDYNITREKFEKNLEDYEEILVDTRWEIHDEIENPLIEAINTVANTWKLNPEHVLSEIYDFAHESASMNQLEQKLRNNETISLHEDYITNEYMQGHVISDIIKELGYDSIILLDPTERFKFMNIVPNSVHIHVFDEYNSNIKSVDNLGTFTKDDPRILFKTNKETKEIQGYFLETKNGQSFIRLLENSDKDTFLHESAHFFLSTIRRMSKVGIKSATEDFKTVTQWWKSNAEFIASNATKKSLYDTSVKDVKKFINGKNIDQNKADVIQRECEELFANEFEIHLKNPSNSSLFSVFERFKSWLANLHGKSREKGVHTSEKIIELFDSFSCPENDSGLFSFLSTINSQTTSKQVMQNVRLRHRYQLEDGYHCQFVKSRDNEVIVTFYNKENKISNYKNMSAITSFNKSGLCNTINMNNGKFVNQEDDLEKSLKL